MNQPDLFSFSNYLLVIAHPDDEVNCAVLLHRLVTQGKQVRILLMTSGDAGVNAVGRDREMDESIARIGLDRQQLVTLGISETELLDNAGLVYQKTLQTAQEFGADCIMSTDYEGGHEGHDIASFVSCHVARQHKAAFMVYADYHFRNMQRHGLEFLPGRQTDYTLELTSDEKDLKINLLEAHRGQIGFYLRLQKNQDDYFKLLFSRETYRRFPIDYDHLVRPDYQIGYEHHRNGFTFPDFVKAAESIKRVSTSRPQTSS